MDGAGRNEAAFMAEKQYDASDARQVNEARKRAAQEHRQEMEVVAMVMSTNQGRRYMYKKLADLGVFTNSFDKNSNLMAFLCGRQAVGHKLQEDIMVAAPEKYMMMCQEAAEMRMVANMGVQDESEEQNGNPD